MMIDQLTDPGPSPVSLVIPCRPEYVALCRLVAGALGARDGLDEEVVADIKVIVTEACDCFLAMASGAKQSGGPCGGATNGVADPGCSLRVEFDSRPGEFLISMLYPEKRALVSWLESCDPASEPGLGLTILKALTDEMVELPDEEGTILRVTKRLPV
jgi:anti-sigma regulatory factor (Ser/Thr protein kinase)